jgi:hypothetical protein
MAVPATRAVVLFQDNFETAAATPFTLKQQLATPSLQTDSDPLNTVAAADAVVPGKWFHYYKGTTPIYDIQVTNNIDTKADLMNSSDPQFSGTYSGAYEGSNVLRLRRSGGSSVIGAAFAEQTSGVVRAKWKMLIPNQEWGTIVERGITFPAQFFFTPDADNDHSDGTAASRTPVTFVNGIGTSPPSYVRATTNQNTASIVFGNATDPAADTDKWQQYILEANLDTQTYTLSIDGQVTTPIPFNFNGGFDTFTFRVAQDLSKATPPGGTAKINATYFVDDLLIEKVAPKWKVDANGNWTDPANWDGSVPNAIGALAEFSSAITQARTVTVDAPVTAGGVFFDNVQSYTVGGTSTLTIQAATGSGQISVANGSHTISAPLVFASDASIDGAGTLTLGNVTNNGTLTVAARVSAGNLDGTGNVYVAPGKTLSASRVREGTITVNGTLTISGARSTAKTSRVTNLSIDSLGHVDLGQNDIVVSNTGISSVNSVRGQITSGYANGAWNGFGLISSSAGLSGGIVRALGYADNNVLNLTAFGDQSVDSTSVLVRYTVAGDADLSGTVDSLDFNRLATGYGLATGAYWTDGDFNYDGKVNTLDFNLLAGGFGQAIPSAALGAVVPEPASVSVLGLSAMLLFRRSRSRLFI